MATPPNLDRGEPALAADALKSINNEHFAEHGDSNDVEVSQPSRRKTIQAGFAATHEVSHGARILDFITEKVDFVNVKNSISLFHLPPQFRKVRTSEVSEKEKADADADTDLSIKDIAVSSKSDTDIGPLSCVAPRELTEDEIRIQNTEPALHWSLFRRFKYNAKAKFDQLLPFLRRFGINSNDNLDDDDDCPRIGQSVKRNYTSADRKRCSSVEGISLFNNKQSNNCSDQFEPRPSTSTADPYGNCVIPNELGENPRSTIISRLQSLLPLQKPFSSSFNADQPSSTATAQL